MMHRFELTGTGISDGQDSARLLELANGAGAIRPRRAYHGGLSNQPYTIRFSAADWQAAELVADEIRGAIYPEYKEGRLCPMIRAYPIGEGARQLLRLGKPIYAGGA